MRFRMHAFFVFALILFTPLFAVVPAHAADRAGCKDLPLLSRMPDFSISVCDHNAFDAYDMPIDSHAGKKHVEGELFKYHYELNRGAQTSGGMAVMRNLQNALKSIGGVVVWELYTNSTVKIVKDGAETWVSLPVSSHGDAYDVVVVAEKPMDQSVVADASALAKGIAGEGKIAVYGIHFDTGKSEIKPDSKPALEEIAKLLSENPALKLRVVGHTDDVGQTAANLTLSQQRAAAVVQALVGQYSIAPGRLEPFGAGPYCPVASNKTPEGKAKNRRVELVEQ